MPNGDGLSMMDLLKYHKYLLDIWEAKVTTQLHTKLIHISKEMPISLAFLIF